MAYIITPKGEIKETFLKIIKEMATEQNSESSINIKQTDIAERSDGLIASSAQISGIMNYYSEQGLMQQIQRGRTGRPSIWDVSGLLKQINGEESPTEEVEQLSLEEEVEVEDPMTEETTVQEPVAQKHDVVIDVVDESSAQQNPIEQMTVTLKEMMSYISSVQEMKAPLEEMAKSIVNLDDGKMERLEETVLRLTEEKLEMTERIQELQEELVSKEEVVQQVQEEQFNKHVVYRSRNYILDEMERYFASPGWQRASKDKHLRMVINNHLELIMKELGLEQPQIPKPVIVEQE